MAPSWLTRRRAFVAAAIAVISGLAVGVSQGSAAFCSYGFYCTPGGPPIHSYTGYGGYGGYGGGGTSTPPPVHFTQTPPSSTTSHTGDFNWEPDAAPPPGTTYNYDCKLDGTPVTDTGSSFECHPPKSVAVSTGDHAFTVAVAGPHGTDGPGATYHWTVTADQGSASNAGGSDTGTTTTTTTTVTPPAGAPKDTTPPKVTLTFRGRQLTLQQLLKTGVLPITISCNEPCTIDISALIDSATAKRLGLISRQVTIGRGKASLGKAGKATVRVKLTKKARARLRKAKSVTLTVKAVVRDRSGNQKITTKRLVLKRKK